MLLHMVPVGSPKFTHDQLHCISVRLKGWRWPHNPGITAAEILTSAFFYNPPGPPPIHPLSNFCPGVAHANEYVLASHSPRRAFSASGRGIDRPSSKVLSEDEVRLHK